MELELRSSDNRLTSTLIMEMTGEKLMSISIFK